MKKKYILMLLPAAMLSITACGKSEPAKETTAAEAPAEAETEEAAPEEAQSEAYADTVTYDNLTSTIKELGEYAGLPVDMESVEVTAEDLEKRIEELLKEKSELVKVDRPAQLGDTAVIDYTGYMNGEAFQGGHATDYPLELGSGSFIDTFEEQLVGASAGDKVEVNVTFPDPYSNPDYAGKPAVFEVEVKEVQARELPELTDAFVKENLDFDTIEALKENLKSTMEEEKKTSAEQNYQLDLVKAFLDNCDFDINKEDVDAYVDEMLNEYRNYANQTGMDLATFLQTYVGMDEASIRSMYEETAMLRLEMALAFHELAEKEGLEVTDEECKEMMQTIADQYGVDLATVEEQYPLDVFREQLLQQKALEFLKEANEK